MSNQTTIAVAILIGFALVATAIFFSGAPLNTAVSDARLDSSNPSKTLAVKREAHRHLYGEAEAPITIVEFSDLECPFCARLHPTLKRLVDESDSKVNWEFRHLPLPSHRRAEQAAVSSECVSRLTSNQRFWDYVDQLFTSGDLSPDDLYNQAVAMGADPAAYSECVANPAILAIVKNDLATARALGGSGTPFSVIVYPDGSTKAVSGALPYERWLGLLAS